VVINIGADDAPVLNETTFLEEATARLLAENSAVASHSFSAIMQGLLTWAARQKGSLPNHKSLRLCMPSSSEIEF
jgi:hypothetical protein